MARMAPQSIGEGPAGNTQKKSTRLETIRIAARPNVLWLEVGTDEGITAMKIWPFDMAAERNRGLHVSAEEMRACLEPFEKICNPVGGRMDMMVGFHSL